MSDNRERPERAADLGAGQAEGSESADDMPMPSPELQAAFDAADELLEEMDPQQARQAAAEMYFDAEGNPDLRRNRIRPVPDN